MSGGLPRSAGILYSPRCSPDTVIRLKLLRLLMKEGADVHTFRSSSLFNPPSQCLRGGIKGEFEAVRLQRAWQSGLHGNG